MSQSSSTTHFYGNCVVFTLDFVLNVLCIQLRDAAGQGDLHELREAMDEGADIESKDFVRCHFDLRYARC